jgi:hypothetical protein
VKFSIRDGYLPSWQANRRANMARPLTVGEGRQALALAQAGRLNVIT